MTIGDGDNFDAGVINAHLDELLAATSGLVPDEAIRLQGLNSAHVPGIFDTTTNQAYLVAQNFTAGGANYMGSAFNPNAAGDGGTLWTNYLSTAFAASYNLNTITGDGPATIHGGWRVYSTGGQVARRVLSSPVVLDASTKFELTGDIAVGGIDNVVLGATAEELGIAIGLAVRDSTGTRVVVAYTFYQALAVIGQRISCTTLLNEARMTLLGLQDVEEYELLVCLTVCRASKWGNFSGAPTGVFLGPAHMDGERLHYGDLS